ncbi:MAG: hypothetical protein ACI8UO_005971 [Verrucomicrobiales bacterium]|jgi:hypothetical protein
MAAKHSSFGARSSNRLLDPDWVSKFVRAKAADFI